MIFPNQANFFISRNTRYHKIGEGSTMAAYVAWTGGNLRTRTSSSHSKFPEGVRGIDVRFRILFLIQSAMLKYDFKAFLEIQRNTLFSGRSFCYASPSCYSD